MSPRALCVRAVRLLTALLLLTLLAIAATHQLGRDSSLVFDATAGNLVVLGSNRPAPMASGACPVPPEAACEACRRASGGQCEPRYGWAWKESPAANDRTTGLPGLQAVRGIDILAAPNVSTVSRWRQSNWAALVRSGHAGVRAGSPARRRALCQLWKGANSYHSWPILLNCPGERASPPQRRRYTDCYTATQSAARSHGLPDGQVR